MSYETIQEQHTRVIGEFLEHLAAAEELNAEACEPIRTACSALVAESQKGMPLQYLERCARVSDWGRVHLTSSARAARKGPHPYYGRGNEVAYIDDYSFTEKSLLVGCRGAVSTFEGKFFTVVAQGKYSVSELFHIVFPAEGDFEYIRVVLEIRDAARYAKGPKEARVIELSDLRNILIPWPSKEVRDAFVLAHGHCVSGGLDRTKSLLEELWNVSSRLVEHIVPAESAGPAADVPASEGPFRVEGAEGAVMPEGDRGALAVAERLLDVIDPSGAAEFADVVAETSDLADPCVAASADHLICFPAPNQGEWTSVRVDESDPRWVLGTPPRNKANYAWIQQTIARMSDDGVALLLLCNAPLHSEIGREQANRENLAQSGLVEAVISLPGGVFDDERPPASFLVLRKGRAADAPVLLIDASNEGKLLSLGEDGSIVRVLPDETVALIAETYGKWLGGEGYQDVAGFCAEVSLEQIAERGYLLSPWAHV